MRPLERHTQVRVGGSALLELDDQLGHGGEAEVFGVIGEPHLAVKLLRTPGRSVERLAAHLAIAAADWLDDDGNPRLAWPIARAESLLKDSNGHAYEGHVMLRLREEDWLPLDGLISGADRATYARHFLTWEQLLVVARNLALLVADMHAPERQIIAADLKAKNALVSRSGNAVALVDCDSMIVRDPGADPHPIVSGNPPVSEETVPPELLGGALGRRGVDTDAWAVAILVCKLLMDGQHPFAGAPRLKRRSGEHSLADNVRSGRTIFKERTGLKVTHPVYPRVLPVALQELAVKCFVDGHSHPGARPAPSEWAAAIEGLAPVKECERVPRCGEGPMPTNRHRFAGELAACPWCELIAGGAPDRSRQSSSSRSAYDGRARHRSHRRALPHAGTGRALRRVGRRLPVAVPRVHRSRAAVGTRGHRHDGRRAERPDPRREGSRRRHAVRR
jgi:eukaryotic-like serine/threonine-protein kinase